MDEGARESRVGYRTDIQGLRAVAIVLVVVCHTGLALPGGFVGVDVFFVVSGFVMGLLLTRELDDRGTLSFGGFYARRARRLLPSLAVMLVVCVGFGILVLNPGLNQVIPFRTAGASTLFVANLYLYRHLGYFDATADGSNPFLHLWSLSVEEQFYLVLPLLVFGAWRLGPKVTTPTHRRRVAGVVGAISAASLWLSWAFSTGHAPISIDAPVRFAFYGAPTRIWELGAGVLAALGIGLAERLPVRVASGVAALGLLVIGASALTIDPLQPFPGLIALVPVIGAVLVLVGGVHGGGVATLLSVRPLRWIGDRSYGWYLWHWPLIVFAGILWPGATTPLVLAALASLAVAAAAYAGFEDRIRRNPTLVGRRAVALAAVCTLVPLTLVGVALEGTERGWGVPVPLDWFDTAAGRGVGCVLVNRDMDNTWPEDACITDPPGGTEPDGTILVLGDFHADSLSTPIIELAAERNLRVAEWGRASCPFTSSAPNGYPACAEWQREALALVDRLDPDLVVIGNRSTAYTTDVDQLVGSNAGRIRALDGSRTTSDAEATQAWGDALGATLQSLDDRGIRAVVVGAAPGYRNVFPSPSVLRPEATPPVRPRADVDAEHDQVVAAERAVVGEFPDAAYVDPVPILCADDSCTPFRDGHWLYYDAFDLNNPGARLLAPALTAAIDEVLPAGR